MIVFLRSNAINPDPRVQKYLDYCEQQQINYMVIGWDRKNERIDDDKFQFYRRPSSFGMGMSNGISIILWNLFLFKKLWTLRKSIKIIHSCDLDTGLVAIMFRLFGVRVIYDVFDWFGDSRGGRLRSVFNIIERFVVKLSDHVIICDEGRIKQMGVMPRCYSVLPNVPSGIGAVIPQCERFDGHIRIAYVGILSRDRFLDKIISTIMTADKMKLPVRFYIAGFGELSSQFEQVAELCSNLDFLGKVDYSKAKDVISNSDAMFAFYDPLVPNNIYAAPNKYYESLALSTPLITNSGTLLSDKVLENETGFIVEPEQEKLIKLFTQLDVEDIENMKIRCRTTWDNKFSDYSEIKFPEIYSRILTHV